ncbi:hypothetical protein BDW67DRAFT_3999 [Aspergillus spinulosporus]
MNAATGTYTHCTYTSAARHTGQVTLVFYLLFGVCIRLSCIGDSTVEYVIDGLVIGDGWRPELAPY